MHVLIYIYIYIHTGKALSSGNEHYLFTEVKESRSNENGYWKEIGATKAIVSAANNILGMKKYLVFTLREGTQTNWIMEEYHISSSTSPINLVSHYCVFIFLISIAKFVLINCMIVQNKTGRELEQMGFMQSV